MCFLGGYWTNKQNPHWLNWLKTHLLWTNKQNPQWLNWLKTNSRRAFCLCISSAVKSKQKPLSLSLLLQTNPLGTFNLFRPSDGLDHVTRVLLERKSSLNILSFSLSLYFSLSLPLFLYLSLSFTFFFCLCRLTMWEGFSLNGKALWFAKYLKLPNPFHHFSILIFQVYQILVFCIAMQFIEGKSSLGIKQNLIKYDKLNAQMWKPNISFSLHCIGGEASSVFGLGSAPLPWQTFWQIHAQMGTNTFKSLKQMHFKISNGDKHIWKF